MHDENATSPSFPTGPGASSDGTAPRVPGDGNDAYDEEHPEHVPGSFLQALPQFFVFPLILVATLTAVYLGLRWMSGVEGRSAAELISEMRLAGPHSRWQVAQQLADGLQRGRLDLGAVTVAELTGTYESLVPDDDVELTGKAAEQASLLRSYMLHVMAFKPDAELRPYFVEALVSEDADVRLAALAALKRRADPETLPWLVPVLASDSAEERLLAIGALGSLGTPDARDALVGLLGGADSLDHRNAVLMLAAQGDARAADWLAPMLSRDSYAHDPALLHPDQALTDDASRAAARAEVVEAFLVNAARAAAHLDDAASRALLVPALQALRSNDPSLKVQSAAINALHDLGAITET